MQQEQDTQRDTPKPTATVMDTETRQDMIEPNTSQIANASRIVLELQPLACSNCTLSKYVAYDESDSSRIEIATIVIGDTLSNDKNFATGVWGQVLNSENNIVSKWELSHGREKRSTIYGSTNDKVIANIVNYRKLVFENTDRSTERNSIEFSAAPGPITSFLPTMSFDKEFSPKTPTVVSYKQAGSAGLVASASFHPNISLVRGRVQRVELELFESLPLCRRPALLSYLSFQIFKWNFEESLHNRSAAVKSDVEKENTMSTRRNGMASVAA